MKITTVIISVMATVLLYGCATHQQKPLSPELQGELDAPLYCTGEQECKALWERAAFFVNTNAGYKIQILSDTTIQTYNPAKYSPKLAFTITKEPLEEGKYRIWTTVWCANAFGCNPDRAVTAALAKRYMRTGKK